MKINSHADENKFSCGRKIILAGRDEILAGRDEVLAGGEKILLADKKIYLVVDDSLTRR